MDKDFHYQMTYIAANIAGYTAKDAQEIAAYAQYVDECVPDRVRGKVYSINNEQYRCIATCLDGILDHLETKLLGRNAVWVPFHFLPGNYEKREGKIQTILPYKGELEDKNGEHTYWDLRCEDFKLVCLPKSDLSMRMIVLAKLISQNTEWLSAAYTGIAAHVLTDTIAHAFYSGKGHWSSNGIINNMYRVLPDGQTERIDMSFWDRSHGFTKWWKSRVYTGHGLAGHMPDYGHVNYRYIPQWKLMDDNYVVEIDHHSQYLFAFKVLVQALYCIRTKRGFAYNKLYTNYSVNGIDQNIVLNHLRAAIDYDHGMYNKYRNMVDLRCNRLNTVIEQDLKLTPLTHFNVDMIEKVGNNFAIFNYAALKHVCFVREELNRNGINAFPQLDKVTDKRLIAEKLNRQYVQLVRTGDAELEEKEETEDADMPFARKDEIDANDKNIDPTIKEYFYFYKDHDCPLPENKK